MEKKGYNIAIDGPAGAGKSTIAKAVAAELGFVYVDTGAMYRAMALFFIREGIASTDEASISEACKKVDITIEYENGAQQVILNGENVSGLIRTEEVSVMTSITSAYLPVREKLVELQKQLAKRTDVIMDGRDIGTCVLPEADLKIFLTAKTEVRARRRYEELTARGTVCRLPEIEKEIEERDFRDTHREHSPLIQAEDAVLIDTSDLTVEEVIAVIVGLASDRGIVRTYAN